MADTSGKPQFRPGPNTPLVDIPDLMGAIGLVDEKEAETALKLQDLFRKQGENTAAQVEAYKAGTVNKEGDTAMSILFRDTEQLKADALKSAAKAAAGMSDDASVNVMNIMLSDIRNAAMDMRAVSTKLKEDKAVSLFDKPLTAIANAFTIPWTEQELRGMAEEQTNRAKSLLELTAGVDRIAAAAEAGKAKVSAATIADRQRALAANLTQGALQIEAAGMAMGISQLKMVQEADQRGLERVRLRTQFWNDSRNQARADEHLAMAREQQIWNRDRAMDDAITRGDKATERKIQLDGEAEILRLANRARINDGLTPYGSIGEIKSKIVTNNAERVRIEDFVERGRMLENSVTAGAYSFGTSSIGALKYLTENRLEPQTKQQQGFVDILRLGAAEEKKFIDSKGTMGSNTFVRQYVKQNIEKYKEGDTSNPNAPVSFGALLSDPIMRANPMFMGVIAPLINDANRNSSAEPNQIFSMLTAASIANPGAVTPGQAALLIKTIYDKSTELNNKNTQIFKWLRVAPEKLESSIHIGTENLGIASSAANVLGMQNRIVNLSDVNSIQLAYTRKIVSQLGMSINMGGEFAPGQKYRNSDGAWNGSYPPLLQSTVVTGAK